MKSYIRTILLLFTASFFMGCAHEQVVVSSEKRDLLKSFQDQFTPVESEALLLVSSFEDIREHKDSIGMARTGALNKNTPLLTDVAVEIFVKNRFQEALSRRKVQLSSDAKYFLKGKIKKLWISELTGMGKESSRCELVLDLDLYQAKSNHVAYHSSVWADITGSNSPLDATDSDGPALNTCVDFAVEKFLSNKEVLSLIKKGSP